MIQSPSRSSYEGYAFEWICFDALREIKGALGIQNVLSDIYTLSSHGGDHGAQIDMVIDRNDRIVNLCEIKYTVKPYEISKVELESLENKIDCLRNFLARKKTIFLTVISAQGIKMGGYASRVNQVVTLDDLFN